MFQEKFIKIILDILNRVKQINNFLVADLLTSLKSTTR